MLQIRRLEAQVAALKKDDKELMEQKMTELLGKMFSPGQIRMILNPSLRKIKWSSEDIARAISLRCVSPKAYRYMKNVLLIKNLYIKYLHLLLFDLLSASFLCIYSSLCRTPQYIFVLRLS
ncbi:uncharacterized protein LOC112459234 [Temnothorax curvispinosus]|uniref:Uncharacterized protein LOC112459234 n=1 Tax=Temnothorax curvispinosus TaxID=300111 RepID=A0A6J1Q9M7_9HYME|nr:uncharacterized protein LOC112459234 [Temnothorax curvispinosus]